MTMQTYIRPFEVAPQPSQTLAVTATSQALSLPTAIGNRSIMITTFGTVQVFWSYDTAAVVATSTPINPNTQTTFFLPRDATTINFIAAGTGTTVIITPGESA